MTKLIIQIPCHNEEETLGLTLSTLPRRMEGVDLVEWLVIDDGSGDRTVEVARSAGVDHIVRNPARRGLARTFLTGLRACLARGADIIVNIDADNQYRAECIPDLIRPILEHQADMVIGARPIGETAQFSSLKKLLQKIGSSAVRLASRTDVPDAASGFRAFSREAALRLKVYNNYTYTLETIIQAGQRGIALISVPIQTNPTTRPSRLIKNTFSYVWLSTSTILRIFIVYRPFRFFAAVGGTLTLLGLLLGLRFLYYFYLVGRGQGHIQSLILASVLIGIGFQTLMVAFLADLLNVNRRLMEETEYRLRKLDLDRDRRDDVPPH
jgi:glycosyltransferase involved in cell wall biosynthesis